MFKGVTPYDELVNKYKEELLNDEQLMERFEEKFEERLAAKGKKKKEERSLS
ncbi:FbpB family small basic protein [Oceanobacillus senegalensis]|uniref:FbpB family small basic protein n=1 Tax=Oceanobacillus senegalensis TaxID=1936063 RepID=UPI000A304AC0|nr:FbpB family small basic protein [Oceanobacillus senegalensis]